MNIKDRVNGALKQINEGASALEVTETIIATDLHDLIYKYANIYISIYKNVKLLSSKVSVNNFDGSRYASNQLKSIEEY